MKLYRASISVLNPRPLLDGIILRIDLPATTRRQAISRLRGYFKEGIIIMELAIVK